MRIAILPLLVAALAASTALAATDGTLGPTSTGSMTITATVPQPANPTGARISGLRDVDLGTVNTQYVMFTPYVEQSFCLYHTSPTARVKISQPDNSGDLLALKGPDGWALNLYITISNWNTFIGSGQSAVSFGEFRNLPSEPGVGGIVYNTSSPTCQTGPRSTLKVNLDGAAAPDGGSTTSELPGGIYSGTIQLLVTTE